MVIGLERPAKGLPVALPLRQGETGVWSEIWRSGGGFTLPLHRQFDGFAAGLFFQAILSAGSACAVVGESR